MTRVLQLMALIAALALPALCQYGRLSPDDQREFDKAYTKYVNDSRKNDRDDIDRDVRKMQDIMTRNNIPPNVPYEQIASSGYGQDNRDSSAYQQNAPYGANQGRLSPDDQREFDKAYDRWVNDSRKNDRDDVERDVRRMQTSWPAITSPRVFPITRSLLRDTTMATREMPRAGSRPTISTSSIRSTKSGRRMSASTTATTFAKTSAGCRTSWRVTTFRATYPMIRSRRLNTGTEPSAISSQFPAKLLAL